MRVLRWILLPLLAIHVTLASISGYRAIVQIYRLDLHVSDAVLRPGAVVGFDVVTSGRVEADALVELVQDTHRKQLAIKYLPRNGNASYDPRPQRASASVTLTPELLAEFSPGPAVVRASALGSMQWLRTPPPTIRERQVEIAPR